MSPILGQTNPVTQTPIVAEEQDYALALGLYRDGVYQFAAGQFGRFMEHYPTSIRRMDALFIQNECRYFQGNYDSAIQGFTDFVRQYPGSKYVCDAQFRRGDSYLKAKKPAEAITAFKIVLDQFGDNDLAGETAYWIGEGYLQLGDFDNAVKYYSLAYENFPKNRLRDYALYSIAWTYQKKNVYPKAQESYARFLKEFPASSLAASAKVRIGECYYYAKDYRTSIDVLTKSRSTIVQNDERGQADYLIAEAYYQLGDYAGAQRRYVSFLREYTGHKLEREMIYALGWTLLKQNKFEEAVRTFNRNANGNDDLAYASLYRRSVAEKLSGQRSAAIATLQDLITRDPKGDYTDNALFDLGVIAFDDKKIPEAQSDFNRVANGFPQSDVLADSFIMLGECFISQSNYNDAHDWFEKAASNPNASFDVKLNSGYQAAWCLYKMKKLPEASAKFTEFIKIYPQHPKIADAEFWLAEAQYQLGNYEGALNAYKVNADAANTQKREEVLYGIGWSYFKMNKFPKAIEAFEQLIAFYPAGRLSFDARLRIGDANFQLKDYQRAEGSYRAIIRLFPKNASVDYAYYQLGESLFRQENYSEAYQQFTSLIKTSLGSGLADDAQYALGWIDFQRKEYADAITEFQTLITTYPSSELVPRALYSTGDSYYNLKKYSDAVKAYRDVITCYPKSSYIANALTGIQYCLTAQGKNQESLDVVDNFLKANSGSTIGEDFFLKKADLLYGQGDYEGAEKEYRQFVQKFPNSKNLATVYFWIAKCLKSRNIPGEAATTLESAISIPTATPKIAALSLYELANIYSAGKKYDRAFEALTRIEKNHKDSEIYPDALYAKANIYVENGNLIDARDQFESVITRFPASTAAEKAKLGLIRIDIVDEHYASAQNRAQEIGRTQSDEIGAEAQYLCGVAFSKAKDWKNAITALLRVKYVFPAFEHWVAKAYIALGDAYIATEDSGKAKEAFQNAEKFKQETETVAEAQKRLKNLE